MNNIQLGETLRKWNDAKEKIELLEKKLKKYRDLVAKEMNRQETEKLSANGFAVIRRRSTRTYLTKESVPASIWKQYSTRCSYDAFFLTRIGRVVENSKR